MAAHDGGRPRQVLLYTCRLISKCKKQPREVGPTSPSTIEWHFVDSNDIGLGLHQISPMPSFIHYSTHSAVA